MSNKKPLPLPVLVTTDLISQEEIAGYLRRYISTLQEQRDRSMRYSRDWHMTDAVYIAMKDVLDKVTSMEIKARTILQANDEEETGTPSETIQ